jgi:hypothetical protein
MQEEALKSGFWSRNKLLKLAKAKNDEQKKLFEDMKKDVDRKEALKLKKREDRNSSTHQEEPQIDAETKKTQTVNRKIIAINKSASLFSKRITKELDKNWENKDKKQIRKELQTVVDAIGAFLGDENEEAALPEK